MPDEPDRVRDDHFFPAAGQTSHGGIEGREQLICRLRCSPRERVEQRRLAGVGVARQRHRGHACAEPAATALRSTAANAVQAAANLSQALAEHALVHLELGLARTPLDAAAYAASGASAAGTADTGLTIEVCPAADQAGLGVSELRELHLELALVGPGAIGEDVQDEFGTGHHPAFQTLFEVALLGGRQLVVEDHQIGLRRAHHAAEFGELARSKEPARVRRVPRRRHRRRAHQVRRAHQLLELVPVRVGIVAGEPAVAGVAHRHQRRQVTGSGSFKQHATFSSGNSWGARGGTHAGASPLFGPGARWPQALLRLRIGWLVNVATGTGLARRQANVA